MIHDDPYVDGAIEWSLRELQRAEKKHPDFPRDAFHAIAILNEEVGELNQAVLKLTYEGGMLGDIYSELLQVIAVSLRLARHLNDLEFRPGATVRPK